MQTAFPKQPFTKSCRRSVSLFAPFRGGWAALALCGVLTISSVGAGAQQTPTQNPPTSTPIAVDSTFRLSAGDTLEISVLAHADLSRTAQVEPDGRMSYPYVGSLVVSGMTVSELTEKITKGLSTEIANPQVTISLVRRADKMISVLGAVRSPGKRQYVSGWRILDLVADCGGLSVTRTDWVKATLVRNGKAIPINLVQLLDEGNLEENKEIEAGDVLLVQNLDLTRTHVQILGEVVKPGWMPTPEDGSLLVAITDAGGPTAKAALSKANIVREGKTIPVDLSTLSTLGAATKPASSVLPGTTPAVAPTKGTATSNVSAAPPVTFRLQPGDTVFIPVNKLKFAIFGAVSQPGAFPFPEGEPLKLTTALSEAGGISPEADLKNAKVVRAGSDASHPQVIDINLEEILKKGNLAQDVVLQPSDIVYLPNKGHRRPFGLQDALGLVPFVGWFAR
jgi:polysaccharide export outer membrane protein